MSIIFLLPGPGQKGHPVPNSLLTHRQAEGKKMQCRSCGRLVVGTKAPETCPVCNHPQSCFEVRKDNY